jgi:hypothetical protein
MNYSSTTPNDATPLPPRLHWQQQSELPETPQLSEPPEGPVSFELVSHDDPKLLAEKGVEQFSNELLKKLDYAQLISTKMTNKNTLKNRN